jgi:hypothetical protein
MTAAAIGSFVVALLPSQNPWGMIAVFGACVALALGFGIFARRRTMGAVLPPALLRLEREGSA